MSNIANHFPMTGLPSRQNPLPDSNSSIYTKQQSFKSQESLDTGLVIHTKEGDRVTLQTTSFSRMDAFMYDSWGSVQTESGQAIFSQNHREVTLASGQSFSFSVMGDLSEDELEDIESILKGLDKVIAEMTQGDMSEALEKALEIGQFDSVSSYSADLQYQRSYEMMSEVTTTTQSLPAKEGSALQENISALATELSNENHKSQGKKNSADINFDKFFMKMLKQLEAHEEKQVDLAKNPIDKLFKHHLDEIGKDHDEYGAISKTLENTMEKINLLIKEVVEEVFKDQSVSSDDE